MHIKDYKLDNMCATLEISKRTYYKYRNTQDKDYYDYLLIKEIFDESKKTYGYRRICDGLLIKYGVIFNHKKVDLIDIYRTFHPKTMNFTFFSSAHGTFSRIDHILGHKASLGKFKKIEIIPSIFSDHNAVRLDLNYRRKTIKKSNIWRLNNTLLNNQQITEEIKKEIKICIETDENENRTTQNLWDTVKAVLRGKFIAIQAHLKKQEKSQINNLTLHLKQLEKEEMKNPRVSRRKEILKIRAEINAKETKETIAKINKTKSWFFETIPWFLFRYFEGRVSGAHQPAIVTGSRRACKGACVAHHLWHCIRLSSPREGCGGGQLSQVARAHFQSSAPYP